MPLTMGIEISVDYIRVQLQSGCDESFAVLYFADYIEGGSEQFFNAFHKAGVVICEQNSALLIDKTQRRLEAASKKLEDSRL